MNRQFNQDNKYEIIILKGDMTKFNKWIKIKILKDANDICVNKYISKKWLMKNVLYKKID